LGHQCICPNRGKITVLLSPEKPCGGVEIPVNVEEVWSWERVFSFHRSSLHGFAVFLVGVSEADDLLSETMVRCQNSKVWPIRGDPLPYLHRALTNTSRKRWRSIQRRLTREMKHEAARARLVSIVEIDEPNSALRIVLQSLSPQQRSVMFHAYWLDLDAATIASRLGVSEGTVRRQLARARARLREQLNDELSGDNNE
jgi:RNA polymerase sigma factor (sigma-70 family)